ncbi:single-stranded DNA-binding protein [Corynebacterium frankenforstense]|uniref:single-stranded DNA-binding protein n=1 Tax=Corynebacterium frankenforstense TaxID=1230998 RepID=UPI00095225B9|nr:single-stranded DNA-binding protein [Corynebacterium frankenforstense]
MAINHPVTLTGNLTRKPWLRRTQTGALVVKMRIAADRSLRDEKSKTGWSSVDELFIDVEAWGDLAYNCRTTLDKGSPIVATGYLVTEEWEGKQGTTEEERRRSRVLLKARAVAHDLNRHFARVNRCVDVQARWAGERDPQNQALFAQNVDEDLFTPQDAGSGQAPGGDPEPATFDASPGGEEAPFATADVA